MSAWRCRHPAVCDAVHEMMEAAKPLIASGAARTVAVVLLGPGGEAMEQFLFEVECETDEAAPRTFDELSELFAATLMKLLSAGSLLSRYSSSPAIETFTILVEALRSHPSTAHALTSSSVAGAATSGPTTPAAAAAAASAAGAAGAADAFPLGHAASLSRAEFRQAMSSRERDSIWGTADPLDPEMRLFRGLRGAGSAAADAAVATGLALPPKRVVLKNIHAGRIRMSVSALVTPVVAHPAAPH